MYTSFKVDEDWRRHEGPGLLNDSEIITVSGMRRGKGRF